MNLDNIQRQLDEGRPVDPADIQALVDKAVYWKRRCRKAELFIKESPCDPDITDAQWRAYKDWEEFTADVDFARERQWVSVEERLPEEDGLYLAHHNEVVFEVIYEDGSFYVPTFNSRVKGFSTIVTHWQHLPEPPSDG